MGEQITNGRYPVNETHENVHRTVLRSCLQNELGRNGGERNILPPQKEGHESARRKKGKWERKADYDIPSSRRRFHSLTHTESGRHWGKKVQSLRTLDAY